MSEHVWAQENLDAYVAGGLTSAEQERLENHVADCAACEQGLAAARALDASLTQVFAPGRPDAGLEDRVVAVLRKAPQRAWMLPAVRALGAIAAVLLLGVVGAAFYDAENEGGLAFPGSTSELAALFDSTGSMFPSANKTFQSVGTTIGNEHYPDYRESPKSGRESFKKDMPKSEAIRARGGEGKARLEATDVDEAALEFDTDIRYGVERVNEVPVPGAVDDGKDVGIRDDQKKVRRRIEETKSAEKSKADSKSLTKQTYDAPVPSTAPLPTNVPMNGFAGGGFKDGFAAPPAPPVAAPTPLVAATPAMPGGSFAPPQVQFAPVRPVPEPKFDAPAVPESRVQPGTKDARSSPAMEAPATESGIARPADDNYFRRTIAGDKVEKESQQGDKGTPDGQGKGQGKEGTAKKAPSVGNSQEKNEEAEPAAPQPARKIIRTGEVEFEVDSFDASVSAVTERIAKVRGGFIATINSDKLPNGKIRGSIVVRMPPEALDQFLSDLRKDLGKLGELKNQRIGSQDVTKHYFDVESRLRAARTMEERLINIIKTGKGEIKDLLNAERELGVWRTKIEEMEGEIRYLNNQVGLSTLTITLYEKEIQAAFALVMTERITLRLEVDEVDKAFQAVVAAVQEVKGRLTHSDFRQHQGGQLEAVMTFEVAPDKAHTVRDKLKTLGHVTHQDTARAQRAEGGTAKAAEIKTKQADVQFHLTLYNIANIQPRETVSLLLAVPDVAATMARLRSAAEGLKAQVRTSQVNEQDKLNVHGQLDFDVLTPSREAAEKALEAAGEVVTRSATQQPPSDSVTDRKVGYRVTLRSLTSIQPRETFTLQVATLDVPATFRRMQSAIAKLKGHVRAGSVDEQNKLNISAQLDFDVPASDQAAIEKLLEEDGQVLTRTSQQASASAIVTDRKVGFRVTLRDLVAIPPREAITLIVAAADVVESFHKLQGAVGELKSHIHNDQLNQADRLNVWAQLDFDLPTPSRDVVEKLLPELGQVISRTSIALPPAQPATTRKLGYRINLRSLAAMQPRETISIELVADQVGEAYRTLHDAVMGIKGQITNGQVSEVDKTNLSATLNFSIARSDVAALEKVLAEAGQTGKRSASQLPINENTTDRKVGYNVTIRALTSVPPRETITLQMVTQDVSEAYHTLQDAVAKLNGQLIGGQVQEVDKLNVTASLDFSIHELDQAKVEKLLLQVGQIGKRSSTQAPLHELHSGRKVGYRLSLRNVASIPPREHVLMTLEVKDMDAAQAKIAEIVKNKSGQIKKANQSLDPTGKGSASITIVVPAKNKLDAVFQLKELGTVRDRSDALNAHVADNELATANFDLTLTTLGPIVPSDDGVLPRLRRTLALSFELLSWSFMLVFLGVCVVLPLALTAWLAIKGIRWAWR